MPAERVTTFASGSARNARRAPDLPAPPRRRAMASDGGMGGGLSSDGGESGLQAVIEQLAQLQQSFVSELNSISKKMDIVDTRTQVRSRGSPA